MSTPTEHLGLHQWEANDDFLRSDFNEDFAKLDQAVGEAVRPPCVAGVCTTPKTAPVEVSLGFRPKLLVFTYWSDGVAGFAMENTSAIVYTPISNLNLSSVSGLTFTDDGFQLAANSTLNYKEKGTLHYVAFR